MTCLLGVAVFFGGGGASTPFSVVFAVTAKPECVKHLEDIGEGVGMIWL